MRLASLALIAMVSSCSDSGGAQKTAPDGKPFKVETVGEFDEPFAMAFLPDGRMLVTEKAGKLKLRDANGRVIDVTGVPAVRAGGQGGLLDVAVAPDFARSRAIYLSYSEPRGGGEDSSLALTRATLDEVSGTASLGSPRVIWRAGSDGQGGQFGAVIAFAPDGKSLFLSSGERQRFDPAQDPNQALGKIIHLTLDGQPAPDNPGAGRTGTQSVQIFDPPANTGAAASAPKRTYTFPGPNRIPAETWTSGHRNPYGLAFDAQGRLWETEMGPKGGDEVNLIERGKNYGWPKVSNGDNYDGTPIPDHAPGDGFEPPKLFWNPSISPGGFMIYSGKLFPKWQGSGFIAALSGEALIRVTLGDAPSKADQWDMGTRIRDVAQGPDGAIWLLEDGGRGAGGKLMRLTPP
ncbi:PQQ-dependent sugar dehydrogenase [Sphingomonas cannabina]|uniref:PQQ-dependent sugar dehydrogenase n=1 Tax=Sphingomonas cannabina TaxID=2899123 RepID=UPI001F3E6EA5|nr:PQQ-dependent sugar dehydrogenase [Sphingomonas cannabina]UIJ45626.1 PQQ-dependent sugar dehydrogenase [Sphingomonas cannabina]